MTHTLDPIPHWTRHLAALRRDAVKRSRIGQHARCEGVTELALAACDGLLRDLAGTRLECDQLHEAFRRSAAAWEELFHLIPWACLLTDHVGLIVEPNPAGVLLNVSSNRLKDRELIVFSDDRTAFDARLHRLARAVDDQLHATITIRPKERKPANFDLLVTPLNGDRAGQWIWFIERAQELHTASFDVIASAALPSSSNRSAMAHDAAGLRSQRSER
ncbi:MAG: hypothetical protein WBC51_20145 [Vicinamibacterales bacterium]